MAEERRHPFDQPVAYPKNLRSHRWPNKAPEQLSDAEYVQEGIHMLVMSHFGHAKRWFAARLESSLHCRTCHTLAVFMIAVVHRSEREMLAAIDVAWEQEAFARSITTPEGRLLQADALLFGSMGQFLTGSYIKGAWNVRSCWKMYHDTWDELQQYHGPDREHLLAWCNFGVGSFNLFGSLLPPTALRFASWLFGLTGERQLGLRKLHNAQEANSFFSPFSAITLLMYYIIMSVFLGEQTEDELREAEDLLAWAKREYPGGTFFSLLQSRYYRCIGKLREAIEECERALAEVPKDLPPNFCIFFTYQKGWSAYLLMEWAESLDYFLPVLDLEDTPDHKTPPIKAFYAYQIGTSYAMLGEKEKALEMFSRVPNLLHPYVKARPIELYSIRKANQFFDTSISDPVLDTFELFMAWDGFANQSQELRYRSLCLLDEAARLHKVEIVPEQRVDFVDGVLVPARGGPSSHSDTLSKRVHAIYSTDSKVEPTAHKSAERAQLDGSHPSGLSETKEALVASAHVIHSSWETPDWNSSKKSRYHLTRAVILRSMNELNLALTELDSAIQAGLEADRSDQSKLVHLDGVLPFAYYQQGLVFLSQNRLADARKAHTLAADYKDYDLFDAVQFRLHSMDQNIEKRERVFGSQ